MRKTSLWGLLVQIHLCGLVLTSYTFLLSCGNSQNEVPLREHAVLDSIHVTTGFPIMTRHSGVIRDPESGDEILYFGDPVTANALRFFDIAGDTLFTVQLDSVTPRVGAVNGISVHTLDSILISGPHNNRLAWIDRSGKVLSAWDVSKALITNKGDIFWMYPSNLRSCVFDTFALFAIEWRENQHWELPDYRVNYLDYVTIFRTNTQAQPHFVRFGLNPDVRYDPEYGVPAFYNRFCKGPSRTSLALCYTLIGGHILLTSEHSDTLYVIDPVSLDIERTVPLHSRVSAVHIPPPLYTPEEAANKTNMVEKRWLTGGAVQNISYDAASNQYLVVAYHQVPLETGEDRNGANRSFSVLAFDTVFGPTAEYVFDDIKYDGRELLSTSKGVYMRRHEDRRTQAGGVHVFDRIEFK